MPRLINALVLAVLTLSSFAGATDTVTVLPTRPIIELRERIHSVLKGTSQQVSLDKSVSLGIGRARSGLIALEEAAHWLDTPSTVSEVRIDRVLAFAERMLAGAKLRPEDRHSLAGYLDLHLKLRTSQRPTPVIRMLYQHKLWNPSHLEYLIASTHDTILRRLTYRALVELVPRASREQRLHLEEALADHQPGAIDLRAMLDEFGTLPQFKYPTLIKSLQRDFSIDRNTAAAYFYLARNIRMRAVERIQTRLMAGDPATVDAFKRASAQPGDAKGREFFRRLGAGELTFDFSEANLRAADPLGLAVKKAVASNVVSFADCARRMSR